MWRKCLDWEDADFDASLVVVMEEKQQMDTRAIAILDLSFLFSLDPLIIPMAGNRRRNGSCEWICGRVLVGNNSGR